VLPFYERR